MISPIAASVERCDVLAALAGLLVAFGRRVSLLVNFGLVRLFPKIREPRARLAFPLGHAIKPAQNYRLDMPAMRTGKPIGHLAELAENHATPPLG